MQHAAVVRDGQARPVGRLHSIAWVIVAGAIGGTVAIIIESRVSAGGAVPQWLLFILILLAATAIGTMTFFVAERRIAERSLLRSVDEELVRIRAESERITHSLKEDERQVGQPTSLDS